MISQQSAFPRVMVFSAARFGRQRTFARISMHIRIGHLDRHAFVTAALGASVALAGEWPEYRGPTHDCVSTETLTAWKGDPKVLWKIKMGPGFGSYAVAGGKAFVFCEDGGQEKCVSLDVKTGKAFWATPIDKTIHENSGGNGPRSTPAVDGDQVFVISTYLKLICLNAATGKPIWGHDIDKEFQGQSRTDGIDKWGNSASPVLDGDLVFLVGGGRDRSMMALDKKTGRVAWAHGNEKLTHATPALATIQGVRQVIFFTQSGLVACETISGKELWRYAFPFSTSTAASPVVFEDIVYCSAGYGVGGGACRISKNGDQLKATEIWRTEKKNVNHWSTPVCKDGYLYGLFGFKQFASEPLKCVDIKTGKEMWSHDGFGQGGVQLVGDHLVVQGDGGQIVMVDASPKEYNEVGRTQALAGKCWNMPVVSDGKLYARSTTEAVCLDVSGK